MKLTGLLFSEPHHKYREIKSNEIYCISMSKYTCTN